MNQGRRNFRRRFKRFNERMGNLLREWVYKRGYSLADLKKIAYALDISLDELDPTQYIDYPELYISKLIDFKNKN